jgi:ketosteroid isomerase-like protein
MTMTSVNGQLSALDREALDRIVDAWLGAGLSADWGKFVSFLTEDAVFLPPDQPVVVGKTAIKVWMEAFPPIKEFTSKLVQADGRGDFAWARGVFEMTVEPTPGQRLRMIGKWTSTFRRQPSGTWLCASDIWNLDSPPLAA